MTVSASKGDNHTAVVVSRNFWYIDDRVGDSVEGWIWIDGGGMAPSSLVAFSIHSWAAVSEGIGCKNFVS